VLGAGNSPAT